jgi:hypothetical protein
MQLTLFCPRCAREMRRFVDEECPPSFVVCLCGVRLSLVVEQGPDILEFPDDAEGDLDAIESVAAAGPYVSDE